MSGFGRTGRRGTSRPSWWRPSAPRGGAIDSLPEIAEICREHGLWLHVDGAFGALAYLSPEAPLELEALAEANSLAFDSHKWMGVPCSAGCAVVRDREAHPDTFRSSSPCIRVASQELGGGRGESP